jgi:hypothetical protein
MLHAYFISLSSSERIKHKNQLKRVFERLPEYYQTKNNRYACIHNIQMPRGRKQEKHTTAQSVIRHTHQAFTAKCVQCGVKQELQPCDICDRAKCATCVEKHREEEKLSQKKAALESKIGILRQQTGK